MTGKIFRSCFLVGLAIMVLCTALFVAVMASRYEDQVYQEMEETAVYVKRGAQYHNALISLESEPDVGTTIAIVFPRNMRP